jgi:hypothetical protein
MTRMLPPGFDPKARIVGGTIALSIVALLLAMATEPIWRSIAS